MSNADHTGATMQSTEYPVLQRTSPTTLSITHNQYGRVDHYAAEADARCSEETGEWEIRTGVMIQTGMNGGGVSSQNYSADPDPIECSDQPSDEDVAAAAIEAMDMVTERETLRAAEAAEPV